MTRWQITKYVNYNPSFLQRVYAYLFIAPNDILEPGYEWKSTHKGRYQSKIRESSDETQNLFYIVRDK